MVWFLTPHLPHVRGAWISPERGAQGSRTASRTEVEEWGSARAPAGLTWEGWLTPTSGPQSHIHSLSQSKETTKNTGLEEEVVGLFLPQRLRPPGAPAALLPAKLEAKARGTSSRPVGSPRPSFCSLIRI